MAGAPIGNNNPTKGKLWQAAINRALEKRSRKDAKDALDELAEKFLGKCDDGDMSAFRELGDRLDGKPTQTIAGTGENGGIELNVNVSFLGNKR